MSNTLHHGRATPEQVAAALRGGERELRRQAAEHRACLSIESTPEATTRRARLARQCERRALDFARRAEALGG